MGEEKFLRVFIVVLLVLFPDCESARGHGSGRHGGHTTPKSRYTTQNSNNNNYQTSQSSIGFEQFQHSQNTGNIGFENRAPQNNQPYYNPAGSHNPSAPQLPQQPGSYNPQHSPPGIGFENVQNRSPQSNYNYGTPTNQNPNYNSYGHQQHNYPNVPQGNGYQPPPNYYNPNYGTYGGGQPPIYQPMQSSGGGSSILGYAGSFAGGYLIGTLASGGFGGGGSSGGGEYTVHHYHHNASDVPKQTSVASNGLVVCSQNETQGLCVPNTFPFCLANGTIMCVTHLSYTTPCNTNNSMPCVVTVLPCANNDTACNKDANPNVTTTAVYVPCISKVSVVQQTVLNFTADNPGSNQPASVTTTDYCITAIAEPKRTPSTVPSFLEYLKQLIMLTYQLPMSNSNNTANSSIALNDTQNKTEMTTLLPVTTNGNNSEITTLPYNT